ncbi:AAA family ATPase [Rhodococcus sp. BP-252]|uniref:BTAD domain-containing putative transcriptional regulator n=1 Tax=unclassified Rhodococcus (in: high G+C Gram-positive bacteria) TaxID=192944 RepID=UPI001C9A56A9|nr:MULTISPECIES: BTAD domain-containing putative transcriptional regulator [unclassified Rhodococcus (in: high G+C Gram-positive bacteria)]MBY6413496.1 AAA family ATPase [Rhodococcus sp. BP-320]MBY6418190.1 AAA family ATPase [Rhodococcus sp. BP-321]MBY6422329.1 AAA family ATPase [Rhodococcus sp. BP-324]MBY6428690.1 AAA family ATPase [Rhodococcus sp. BP-323]MBY6433696.1 AAA family ATPase [Rhodococcus sp. BP-322]
MSTSHPLSIHVLGPLRALRDGNVVDLAGPGRRAVLTRLALAKGAVVSTDLLIEDLWSGEPPPKALAALQVHVSNLRRVLEPERLPRTPATILISSSPGYALNLPAHAVDAWHFESLLTDALRITAHDERLAILDTALGVWAGRPYQEVADTSWAAPEIARLDELHRTAVEERARTLLELGEPPTAVITALIHHVSENPGRERPAHLLALAQYRAGRQADALDTIGRARTYLANELGIDPGSELRTLEADILAQSAHLEAPRRVDAPALRPKTLAAQQRINCRPDETETVLTIATTVAAGQIEVVWVGGEPGQGKTTLASNVVERLRSDGWTTAWGRCREVDGTPPGWPWADIAAALSQQFPMPSTIEKQLLPLMSNVESIAVEPFWLSKALADYLALVADNSPVAVILDDCHRADELTMQILRHLLAALASVKVLVVATFRSSEVSAELDTTWAATAGAGSTKIHLTGLSAAGVAEVARHSGYTEANPAVLQLLSERTDGNPLFVREFARLILSEGSDVALSAVPDTIGDVLRRRITRLPGESVTTLRRASVLGRDVDLGVLASMGERSEDALLDALEPAVLAGLLIEPSPDRLRFTHALVRDTLYGELPLMRRTRLHGAALRVLADRTPNDHAALAHHAILSATPSTAMDVLPYAVDAARRYESLGSHREALALWRSAAALHAQAVDASPSSLLEVLAPLVGSLARAGDTTTARAERQRAIDIASGIGRPELIAALTSWNAPVVWSIRSEVDIDRAVVDHIESALDTDDLAPRDRALLLVALVFEIEGDDTDETIAAATEAVDLARETGDSAVLCRALNALGYIALGPDLADRLPSIADELLTAADGDAAFTSLAYYYAFLAHCAATELDAAESSAAAAIQHASGHQLGEMLGVLQIYEAASKIMAGNTDAALAEYSAIAEHMVAGGNAVAYFIAMIGRLGVATYLDDLSPMVDELSAVESMRPHSLRLPLIVALLDRGDVEQARQLWSDARPYPRDYYWLGMTTYSAHAAARLGDIDASRRIHDELLPFAGRIGGLNSGAFYAGPVDFALAATAKLLGDITAAEEFERSGDRLIESLRRRGSR